MLKLNRSIANASKQSYMHMIVCGIRRHQNWEIGPSLGSRERTVETLKIQKILLKLGNIFVIIVGIWSSKNNWCISVCIEKQIIWIEIDVILRNFVRSYHQLLTMIEFDFGHWNHRIHLVELITRHRLHIYIIVGEWYKSHICGRSPCLRYTSCTRRRVWAAEKQLWLLLPSTPGLADYCIVLLGCQK